MALYKSYRVSNSERIDRGSSFLRGALCLAFANFLSQNGDNFIVVNGKDRKGLPIDLRDEEFEKKYFYYIHSDIPRKALLELGNNFSFLIKKERKIFIDIHGHWNVTSNHNALSNVIMIKVWKEDFDGQSINFLRDLSLQLEGSLEEMDPTLGGSIRKII